MSFKSNFHHYSNILLAVNILYFQANILMESFFSHIFILAWGNSKSAWIYWNFTSLTLQSYGTRKWLLQIHSWVKTPYFWSTLVHIHDASKYIFFKSGLIYMRRVESTEKSDFYSYGHFYSFMKMGAKLRGLCLHILTWDRAFSKRLYKKNNVLFGPALVNDMQTLPPQKVPSPFFGPNCCAMF